MQNNNISNSCIQVYYILHFALSDEKVWQQDFDIV